MAMKLYSDSNIQDIADAIRSVNGSSDTYKVREMAAEIRKFFYTPDTPTPSVTNLVQTAYVPTDHTTIYNNGLGYRDDAYISGTDYGAHAGYCCTGAIDIPTDEVGNITNIYIRGGNITTNSHCRFNVYRYESTTATYTGSGSADNGWMTGVRWITAIDQLADKYWRLTVDPSWGVAQMGSTHRQFRVGVEGLGSELFVSFNDPITDDVYNAFLNS